LAQCPGSVVEYRLCIVAGGENHLPPSGGVCPRGIGYGLADEHAEYEYSR
jgi:hypothetical protein